MVKKTDQWMPFYVGDYLADTQRLNTEGHGAYMLTILDYWRNGPLPDDDKQLAAITKMPLARWKAMRPNIAAFYEIRDGFWFHKRIQRELAKAKGVSAERSEAGTTGATAKWGRNESAYAATRAQRLTEARLKGRHTPAEWGALMAICGDKCLRCGKLTVLVKDHIKPIYQGGSDAIDNLQPICASCNSAKGSDATDLRPNDWQKRLAECLANARQTPAQQQQHSQSPEDAAADRATPGDRVLAACGVTHDPRWFGDSGRVEGWIRSGADLELDILPTIKRVMAKRGAQGPPGSLKYFDQAIADAMETRKKPLPTGHADVKPTRSTGNGFVAAALDLAQGPD